MHPVSCTNNHCDDADIVNHGWLKIQKLEYLENRNKIKNKKKSEPVPQMKHFE